MPVEARRFSLVRRRPSTKRARHPRLEVFAVKSGDPAANGQTLRNDVTLSVK